MKDTVRLNFEFPREHYPYLKMLCAKKGLTLKDFATRLLINELDEYEDRILAEKADKSLKDIESGKIKTMSLEQAEKYFK